MIMGGWDRQEYFDDWWEYDLVQHVWRRNKDFKMPCKLGQFSACRYKNQIVIFAGFQADEGKPCSLLWTQEMGHPIYRNSA